MVVGLCVWWVWWVLIEEYVGLYVMQCFVVGFRGSDRGGAGRGRQGRDGQALCKGKAEHRDAKHRVRERQSIGTQSIMKGKGQNIEF